MITKKAWILTKKGLATAKKYAAGVSIGFLCYEIFPHSVLLPFYRVQQEEEMKAKLGFKELPYEVQEYVRRAIDDLKFTEDQRKALSVYLSDSHQVRTLGNVNSIFGTLVKLPWSLWSHYPFPETLPGEGGKNPEASKEFLESRQWSDKAKLFFTAYQVAWTTRYQFVQQGLFNAAAIAAAFVACYTVNTSKNPVVDHSRTYVAINFIILSLFFITWMLATDLTTCDNEKAIIEEVCGLGQDYAEGAVELYKKQQQHNRAVREITGSYGRHKYSPEGNTKSLRQVTIPLSERLQLAEKVLETYKNETHESKAKNEKNDSNASTEKKK